MAEKLIAEIKNNEINIIWDGFYNLDKIYISFTKGKNEPRYFDYSRFKKYQKKENSLLILEDRDVKKIICKTIDGKIYLDFKDEKKSVYFYDKNNNNSIYEILNYILLLYLSEKFIENQIKEKSLLTLEDYVLVNKEYIKTFKQNFKYEKISSLINQTNSFHKLEDYNNKMSVQKYHSLVQNNCNLEGLSIESLKNNILDFDYNFLSNPVNMELIHIQLYNDLKKTLPNQNQNESKNYKIYLKMNDLYIIYSTKIYVFKIYETEKITKLYAIIHIIKEEFTKMLFDELYHFSLENFISKLVFSEQKKDKYIYKYLPDYAEFFFDHPISYIKQNNPQEENKDKGHTLGLENIFGNYYTNSILQCLFNINILKNYFQDKAQIEKEISLKKNDIPLTICFYKLINALWNKSDKATIKKLMTNLFQKIKGNDAKNLIINIYETLHKELINPNKAQNLIFSGPKDPNIPQELLKFRYNNLLNNYSIIMKHFYFEKLNVVKCPNCQSEKSSYSISNFINFPLEKIRKEVQKAQVNFQYISLIDCFEKSQMHEQLEHEIVCNNCSKSSRPINYSQMNTCPDILTIIFYRGNGLEHKVYVKFPLNLDISNYVKERNKGVNYELIGVVNHDESKKLKGCCLAKCKSPVNNKWYFYDDEKVEKIEETQVNEDNSLPYILFYQKIETFFN